MIVEIFIKETANVNGLNGAIKKYSCVITKGTDCTGFAHLQFPDDMSLEDLVNLGILIGILLKN